MCTHKVKFMYLHLCMHSVRVRMHPVDPVPIVTAISRVCSCGVESSVGSEEVKRTAAARSIYKIQEYQSYNIQAIK